MKANLWRHKCFSHFVKLISHVKIFRNFFSVNKTLNDGLWENWCSRKIPGPYSPTLKPPPFRLSDIWLNLQIAPLLWELCTQHSPHMYEISYKLSPEFMWDLVEEINTKCQTRSSYNTDIDDNEKIEYTKKLPSLSLLVSQSVS